MYGSSDMECNGQNFLSFWIVFCPFTHLTIQKIKILKNWKKKKNTWRYYYFTHVYHKWIIWCMVPKIWSMMDRIFCHFGLFFALLQHPNNPKNQNFEKMKKTPGDIIILQMYTLNGNRIMHGSWHMEHVTDRIFCNFGPFFVLLPP